MKAIAAVDGFIFRCLYAVMHWIDGYVPFSRKTFARLLLALYLFGIVGGIVSYHQHVAWIIVPGIIMVSTLLQTEDHRFTGRQSSPLLQVFRVVILLLFVYLLACDCLLHLYWNIVAYSAYTLMIYVVDMDDDDRGRRHRVLDAIRETSEKPGYTTA